MIDALLLVMVLGRTVKQGSMSLAQVISPLTRLDQQCHVFFLLRKFVESIDNVISRKHQKAAVKLVQEIH